METNNFDLSETLKDKQPIIGVIGLGYVGLPLAVAFGKLFTTIGFDINQSRVNSLKNFEDPSGETSGEDMVSAKFLSFTCDPKDLAKCSAFIIAVPTPVDKNNRPDISPLISASKTVGSVMKSGSLVVYESTVYPGCTEEDCVPVLELTSGKKLNKDFFVGYSPERINPGDKNHSLKNVVKITSGSCEQAAQVVDWLYSNIALAGTCPVKSIKVAEAAKVIENAQRDINIAFVNELSMIFHRMGIDTQEVLNAACTKWNFRDYRPGLVGGHCFAASQLVVIKRGYNVRTQTIKEYVENGFLQGDQVLSFDVESRELIFKNILSCSTSAYEKMVLIVTERGHKCVITDKHPMLVFENEELMVKHADNIMSGDLMPFFYGVGLPQQSTSTKINLIDHIPFEIISKVRVAPKNGKWTSYKEIMGLTKKTTPRLANYYAGNYLPLELFLKLEAEGRMPLLREELFLRTGRGPSSNKISAVIDVDQDFSRFIGYYLAEGCVSKDESMRTRFTFNENEKQYILDVQNMAEKLGISSSTWHNKKDHCVHVKVSSEILGILIKDVLECGCNCYEKNIPSIILYDKDLVLSALSGIFRGDGSLKSDNREANNSCSLSFSSSSKVMFNQICCALLSHKMHFSTSINKAHPRVNHLTLLGGQKVLSKWLALVGSKKRIQLKNHLDACRRHPKLNYKFDKGLWLVPVKSISIDETPQNVFSLEVEDTKTIVTDSGWIVHNCIGVDPYYLSHKAQEYGYHPEVILAGRKLNDSMGTHVAQEVVKLMILKGHPVKGSSVAILGCTFKENCADARNSKVFDIIKELLSFGCVVHVVDPFADADFVKHHYGISIRKDIDFASMDAVVVAVAHNDFKTLSFGEAKDRRLVVYDVKGILPEEQIDGRL